MLLAVQKAADARTKQIQWKIHALKEQTSLEIDRIRISSPGRWMSEKIAAAECYAVNGDPMKEARSRYLSAYVRRSFENPRSLTHGRGHGASSLAFELENGTGEFDGEVQVGPGRKMGATHPALSAACNTSFEECTKRVKRPARTI